jgi:NTE family protein
MSRALVLAGGGLTGIAWELGVLLGLRDEGVELIGADVVVGTSAGATVGAQVLSGTDLADLYDRQIRTEHGEIAASLDIALLTEIFGEMAGGRLPDQAARVRIGVLALAAETLPEARRREVIAARLPSHAWPATPLRLTAVDAATGERVVFDAASGVDLIDAVAASCAVPGVWPPVTIGARRYIDGGMQSPANADVAQGHETVVVLAPLAGRATSVLDPELDALRSAAEVIVISSDDEAAAAMGENPLDPSYRPPAATAGRRQGRAVAGAVAAVWNRLSST